ncbi:MAG: metallophosphoesterase family protein [Candidatus Hadarchaeum sp.]
MARYLQTPKIVIPEDEVTFGIVSDTHFGSYYSDISLLNQAYEIFLKEKVDFVFHAGDLLDGEKMYRGHEYEIFVHGADNQVKYCIENYPSSGIKTYFIDGNHDRSFWRRAGVCTGERIASLRDDLVYLGYQEADVEFSKGMFIRVYHPEDGSAYALSYKPQRYISELSGKNKPQLLVVGHYHKAEKLFYRNIAVIQAGTLQRQTPYMRGKKISAAVGFWIVRLSVSKDILRIRSEFFNVDS